MNYYLDAWRKFATFSGRARRSEYWMFYLFNTIAPMVLAMVELVLGTMFILTMIYMLAAFIPGLSVTVRRLHDIGKSGWWMLINFVPVIGFFVFLFFMFQDSQHGDNEYGPNPKMVTAFA